MKTLDLVPERQVSSVGPLLAATRAEITKFRGSRSLTGLYAAGILATIALGWLLGASAKASGDNGFDTAMPAPLLVFATLQFGQLFFAAAAALHMTGEYSSGTITSTLQAVPRRGIMVGSKAVVLGALGMATGLVLIPVATIPTALGAGQYGQFAFADLFSASMGAGTYLALLNLMVLGLGLLCRNSAGALVSLIALVLGLPQILQLIPMDWVQTLIQYLPTNAATFMATGATEPYGPAMAFVILVAWSAALLGAGTVALKKRDA